jgi:hypothetical protein
VYVFGGVGVQVMVSVSDVVFKGVFSGFSERFKLGGGSVKCDG